MQDLNTEKDFQTQVTNLIMKNISNEQFGVSDLADQLNMSRSNLLRKVKKQTGLSVSQLISQVRLKRAMELLRTSSLNVSEVSHQVGFNSASYFIKCFREYYGYPPGEVGKRESGEPVDDSTDNSTPAAGDFPARPIANRKKMWLILTAVSLVVVVSGVFIYYRFFSLPVARAQKSIAVLPFKNDSNDSTNIYLINGLMESTLNNLLKIKALKVTSRTSAEKYRNTTKSVPEVARELNVSYIVEGSGQKIGDHILLNIQLIEAATDKHLWARQYRREGKDIFELQQEIARNIAGEIEAIITPEEERRLAKKPTRDVEAYDLYLKGKHLFYQSDGASLLASVPYFRKAIERDPQFAQAYAEAAMVYYYLDMFQVQKRYTVEIGSYADRAMLLDSLAPESLIAKAVYFTSKKEYKQAVPYYEKALEYNPDSGLAIHFLVEFYNIHEPNTGKYLEYALRKFRLDMALRDSATVSYNYLQLANALVQSGFKDEAIAYIDKSIAFNPQNPFAYIRPYILYAKTGNVRETLAGLQRELKKDSNRFEILQEVGWMYYLLNDFKASYRYYKRFIEIKEAQQLDIFRHADLAISIVLAKNGQKEKSEEYLRSYKQYADNDKTIYKNLSLANYYCHIGDKQKAMEYLKLFAREHNFQYWVLLLQTDSVIDPIRNLPEFKETMKLIEIRFWEDHEKIKATLEEKGLL